MFEGIMESMGGLGGWALAIGAIAVAPTVGRVMRPVAKEAVKGYLAAVDGIQSAAQKTRGELQDIVAEVKTERQTAP